ncbi:MAG: hypothetical protein AAGE52_07255 [Myxococcota bacterium]
MPFSLSSIALTVLLVACGPRVAPAPRTIPLRADEAEELVRNVEQELAETSPPTELDHPESLDDVLRILQSDRIDLFSVGIEQADALGGVEGAALAAQLEFSWGEGQRVVSDVLVQAAAQVEAALGRTSSRRGIGARRRRLAEDERRAREAVASSRRLAEALAIVAERHISQGAERTRALFDANREHYLSYRLAADFYRLEEDWERFDASIVALEERRPDSTGLKFLRGAAALRRSEDAAQAMQHLRGALEDDPQFTRAQVFLLASQEALPDVKRELDALRVLSPYHQLVVWAGPLLEQGYVPFADES